jgi:poly(3-hydroxyoctanoate) depolymerase
VSAEATADIERIVDICGRPVRVRVHGEGHPVLLINGLGANVATWTPLVDQLPGFQLICFDAPGTGRSKSPARPYRIAHIAEVASRVLDEVGVERADVLGYSLGGAVAQQLAYQRPDRVRRLVLVSTSCGIGAVPGSLRAMVAVMTPARHYSTRAHRLATKMVDLPPAERESPVVAEQLAERHREGAPSVLGYSLQMAAFSAFSSLPWLHHIQQPTLLLAGTDDRLVPMENSAVLAAYLPNARLQVVERWGHYLLLDPASGAGHTVADFLTAEDYAESAAWNDARAVSQADMAAIVRSAPRTAHPALLMNRVVRTLHGRRSRTD